MAMSQNAAALLYGCTAGSADEFQEGELIGEAKPLFFCINQS
jgi:hypothetical protein